MIRKLVISLLFITGISYADGPQFKHKEANIDREFVNAYQDIRSVLKGTIGPLTISTMTVSSMTATNAVISVSTITTLTVSNLSGVRLGKVLQIATGTSATTFATTSTSYQATNLTGSITPLFSTSRVLIIAIATFRCNTAGQNGRATIKRGSTDLSAVALAETGANASDTLHPATIVFLDSPATTSNTTYTVNIKGSDGVANVSWGVNSVTQSIFLVEIAA